MVAEKKSYFIIAITILLFLIVFLYGRVFTDLLKVWNEHEEYSHGFMIPLVSLYFIWQKKDLIIAEQVQSIAVGFLAVTLALLFYFVGTIGDLFGTLRLSFIFLLLGGALIFVGYKSTKLMLTPILMLIFSFPLPTGIQADLTVKLQLLSSQLGVAIIRACQIPVYLEGNVIDLGSYQLQVIEACSGLNYLFPLMSLAFICAYLYQVKFWKRIIIFLTSIPITLFMNSFRIGVIGLLVNSWGIAAAEGFIHFFEGWIVFMVCFAILFLEMWVMSRQERKTQNWETIFGLTVSDATTVKKTINISLKPIYGLILLLCLASFFIKPLEERQDFIPPRKDFSNFPTQISTWHGIKDSLESKTVKFLGLSDYVLIDFKNTDNTKINFYIAYYQTQKHNAAPHTPKLCIPGGGWEIKDVTSNTYQNINFNRILIQKDDIKQLVYYWYKQKNKNFAGEYQLKWNTFMNSLENKRSDAALIRLSTILSPNESVDTADQRLQKFMLLVGNNLSEYVPN